MTDGTKKRKFESEKRKERTEKSKYGPIGFRWRGIVLISPAGWRFATAAVASAAQSFPFLTFFFFLFSRLSCFFLCARESDGYEPCRLFYLRARYQVRILSSSFLSRRLCFVFALVWVCLSRSHWPWAITVLASTSALAPGRVKTTQNKSVSMHKPLRSPYEQTMKLMTKKEPRKPLVLTSTGWRRARRGYSCTR